VVETPGFGQNPGFSKPVLNPYWTHILPVLTHYFLMGLDTPLEMNFAEIFHTIWMAISWLDCPLRNISFSCNTLLKLQSMHMGQNSAAAPDLSVHPVALDIMSCMEGACSWILKGLGCIGLLYGPRYWISGSFRCWHNDVAVASYHRVKLCYTPRWCWASGEPQRWATIAKGATGPFWFDTIHHYILIYNGCKSPCI